MILIVLFKSLFFLSAISFYSVGMWNMINGYFGQEFKTYLAQHPPPSMPSATRTSMKEVVTMEEALAISGSCSAMPQKDCEASPVVVTGRRRTEEERRNFERESVCVKTSLLNQLSNGETTCRNYYWMMYPNHIRGEDSMPAKYCRSRENQCPAFVGQVKGENNRCNDGN